jgi:hypothetical protein
MGNAEVMPRSARLATTAEGTPSSANPTGVGVDVVARSATADSAMGAADRVVLRCS